MNRRQGYGGNSLRVTLGFFIVTVHLPLQDAPFSTVERGEGPPRWRFCYFRYQQRWIP